MSTKPARASLACLLAMAVGAGCGSGTSSSSSPNPHPTTVPSGSAAADAKEGLTLEESGDQPRQPLLLHIAAGTTSKVAVTAKIGLDMRLGRDKLPGGAAPATRIVLDQRVDSVDADGTTRSSVTFADVSVSAAPGVSEEVVSQTQAALDQLKGVSGTATADAHGGAQKVAFDTSGVTDPVLRSTMDSVSSQIGNLTAPFPVEPVGRGARWTARRTATINGITLNTTTTFTLAGRTGDSYRLDVDQSATAPPGPVKIPNLPAGTETSVESYVLHSTGHVEGNVTRPVPDNSANAGAGDAKLTISEGADRETLTEHITIDFSLSPA